MTEYDVTNIASTQPRKNMITMGKMDISDLMMIIAWAIDVSFQSRLLKWASWTHTTPYIVNEKKVIDRTMFSWGAPLALGKSYVFHWLNASEVASNNMSKWTQTREREQTLAYGRLRSLIKWPTFRKRPLQTQFLEILCTFKNATEVCS